MTSKIETVYFDVPDLISRDPSTETLLPGWELSVVLALTVAKTQRAQVIWIIPKKKKGDWEVLTRTVLKTLGVLMPTIEDRASVATLPKGNTYLLTGRPESLIKFVNYGGRGRLIPTDFNNTHEGKIAEQMSDRGE